MKTTQIGHHYSKLQKRERKVLPNERDIRKRLHNLDLQGAGDSSSSTKKKWIHQLLHLLQRKESPVWAVLLE